MRIRILTIAIVLAAPALTENRTARPLETTLAIITRFDHLDRNPAFQEMRRELDHILRPLGLRIEWWPAEEDPPGRTTNHLVTVWFRGECSDRDDPPEQAGNKQLGLTHITDGELLPYVEIDCEGVRSHIRAQLRASGGRAPLLLGRALARVLAHEMYHVLAKTREHGEGGLGRAQLSPDDLLCPRLTFPAEQMEAMRLRVAGHVYDAPGPQLPVAAAVAP
jgi:hypothetical protein